MFGFACQVIRWFWLAVEAMTYEERVRLLQVLARGATNITVLYAV